MSSSRHLKNRWMQRKEAELVRIASKILTSNHRCKKRNKNWHRPSPASPWKTACHFQSISVWVAQCKHTQRLFTQQYGLRMLNTQSMPTCTTRLSQSSFKSLKIVSGTASRWYSSTSSRRSVISTDLMLSSCRLNIRPLSRPLKVSALKNLWKFMAACLTKSKYALFWPLQAPTQGPCRTLLKTTLKASFVDCLTSRWRLNPTDIQQLSSHKMLMLRRQTSKKRRGKEAHLQWARKLEISLMISRIISYRYMLYGGKRVMCIVALSSSPSEPILWTQCSWHRMGEWLEVTTATVYLLCSLIRVCTSTQAQSVRKDSIKARNVKQL